MQIAAKVCFTLFYSLALHKEVSANKAVKAIKLGKERDDARVAAVAGSQSANMWPASQRPHITQTHAQTQNYNSIRKKDAALPF